MITRMVEWNDSNDCGRVMTRNGDLRMICLLWFVILMDIEGVMNLAD